MSRSAKVKHRFRPAGPPAVRSLRAPGVRGAGRLASGISLCMIVRDEERFLRACLESVQGLVDEICIVDTGSVDGTIAVAQSFGARISRVTWRDDFAWARNEALAMATRAWILVLDADERLAPGSRAELQALRAQPPDGRGRWIRCRNLNERGTTASTNAIVRIFPNDPAVRYRGALHEYVALGEHVLPAQVSPIEILHSGYAPQVVAERNKGERNVRLSRAALDAAPDDPTLVYNYAMSLMLAGDRAGGRDQLRRVVALTEHTPRGFRPQALVMLSAIYHDEGDAEAALTAAEDCLRLTDTLADAHYARGRALAAVGRLYEARDAFGAALAAGGNGAEHFVVDDEVTGWKAHNELAGTLMREERFAEAEQWLELALRAHPPVPPLLVNRARCREAAGDLAAAGALFRAAFEEFGGEMPATEFVNFVFRHGSPDAGLAAVESALPAVGEQARRVFLGSAAALILRAGREAEAAALAARALGVAGDAAAGQATLAALADYYRMPELNRLSSAALAGVSP